MVNVPLISVDVPVDIVLSLLTLPLLVCKVGIRAELVLVDVTLVVAASGGSMLTPVAHADPAEVVIALAAGHVVAALVLLDVRLAARACLGVGQDPGRVLTLRALLLNPELGLLASARFVRIEPALEAELNAAIALDFLQELGMLDALARQFARDIGAPLDGGVLVGERLDQPLPILVAILLVSVEEPLKDRVSDFDIAN